MGWIYLIIAGIFEIGWPLGFKLSVTTGNRVLWMAFALLSMALSGLFLWMAQKQIPIGTAYIVWTGMGALGTFMTGIFFFNDQTHFLRLFSAFLILAGIVGIKLAEQVTG